MQYAAHVRDILRAYGDRVILVMAKDEPTVPQLNPNSEEWEAYNRLDVKELADDLEAQAARLADLLAGLDDENWRRTFIRDGGQDGIVRYDLAGLASYAVHEAHHHLLDADGTLPVGGGSKEPSVGESPRRRARSRRKGGPPGYPGADTTAELGQGERDGKDRRAVRRTRDASHDSSRTGRRSVASSVVGVRL